MAHTTVDPVPHADGPQSTKASLERIKKQLSASGRFLLQGPLLKRSETLRKWNQRWFTLDPTTGKMEYRVERGDTVPKGLINFDASSTIAVSPINFQGVPKYDGCCIYIETLGKKEYFLCAETPGSARAWVSTLQAAQLVLKAHKEAVNSLGGSGSSKLGTVAAVVAAANATAKEAAKEIATAMQSSTLAPLKSSSSQGKDGFMDDLSIMKETLKVKDEELHQMAKELRARDATIKELAERLSETAEAAEAAASAAHIMDKERKAVRTEIAKLRRELDDTVRLSALELKSLEGKLLATEKARDEALQEAHNWRVELGKAREHAVVMEAAVVRAEESARHLTDTELQLKACLEREAIAMSAKVAAEKEVELLRTLSKSAVMSENLSRGVEIALDQLPILGGTEQHSNFPYSSETVEPPLMGHGEYASQTTVVASSPVLRVGQLANAEAIERRAENAFDPGLFSLEQQRAAVPDLSLWKNEYPEDLTKGVFTHDISGSDAHPPVKQGGI